MADLKGFEPLTSSMPWTRAPNCATAHVCQENDALRLACNPPFYIEKFALPKVTAYAQA
jgi:hypothetical protein